MHSKAESVGSRASALRLTRSVGRWPVAGASVARAFHCVAVNDQPALACAHTHTHSRRHAHLHCSHRTANKNPEEPSKNIADSQKETPVTTLPCDAISLGLLKLFFFYCHQVCVFFVCVCVSSLTRFCGTGETKTNGAYSTSSRLVLVKVISCRVVIDRDVSQTFATA